MYELVEFGKSPVEVQDFRNITGCFIVTCWTTWNHRARAKQHVHWFLGGKVLGTQQRTSVWVGSPKSNYRSDLQTLGILTDYAAKKKGKKKSLPGHTVLPPFMEFLWVVNEGRTGRWPISANSQSPPALSELLVAGQLGVIDGKNILCNGSPYKAAGG